MKRQQTGIFVVALLLLVPLNAALAGVTASYRYGLSNFSGPVLSHWAKLAVDPERNEIYALNRRGNDIRIFDEHGMEIYVFGEGFATAADLAIAGNGNIFILSTGYKKASVHLANYRGELLGEIPLSNVPEAYSNFVADRIMYERGSLYLVDSDALMVILVDETGRFERGYDLNRPLRQYLPRETRFRRELKNVDWAKVTLRDIEINGFTVDRNGNMLFTIPVLFSGFRMSVDGELTQFGAATGSRGKFGVAAGITTDDSGYIYVSDRLRCVVMVFDEAFTFQTEFGYRGDRPSNLIVPDDLAIDPSGNLYVGQAANRGVSVFKVVHDDTSTSQLSSIEPEAPVERGRAISTAKRERATGSQERRRTIEEDASDRLEVAAERGGRKLKASSEKPGRAIVENAPDRVEFTVDHGDDTPTADSGEPSWVFEETGTNQAEVKSDEEE
jgi:DNA-binding beta-propeller fold protein YncE